MKKEKSICLFLFVVLIVIFSSCHPRRVSDIRPSMTKDEVISAWGGTSLINKTTTNGITLETWEYHFAGSHSLCQITFNQDRVTDIPQCNRPPVTERYYVQTGSQLYPESYYYQYPYLWGSLWYPWGGGYHGYHGGYGGHGGHGGGGHGGGVHGGGGHGGGGHGGGRGGGR